VGNEHKMCFDECDSDLKTSSPSPLIPVTLSSSLVDNQDRRSVIKVLRTKPYLPIKDICQKMNLFILLPLMLAGVTAATSFSNLINVQQSNFKEGHSDCLGDEQAKDTMLSLSSCLNGCVELHSAFVNVDNDEVDMNTDAYNTTLSTHHNTSKNFSHLVTLLLLWALAFATMEAYQLLLLMMMLLVSGGLSTDVVVSFFGAWLVNYYLGVSNQTEQGEEGYDIEKDMYYDCEEEKESFGLTWKEGKLKWIEI